MNLVFTKPHYRMGIVLNYLSLVLLVALVYTAEALGWSAIIGGGIGLATLILLVTLVQFHIRTGLWRLVHACRRNLSDEQVSMIHRSLHSAYGPFAILSLLVLLWKSVFPGPDPNLIVAFAALLYLAHTLPSAVIGWRERNVPLAVSTE